MILGGLSAIIGRKDAIVDGLGPVIRRLGAARGGLGAFVRGAAEVARGAIPRRSVEIARRVIARLGLSVTQPGRDVAVLRSEPRLPAARADQLIGPGVLAIPGCLGTIFGRNFAVVDGLGAVVRGPGAPRGGQVTFVCGMLPVGRRAIAGGSVKITGRVIARLGLTVAHPCCDVTVFRRQPGLPAAYAPQFIGA